MSSIDSLLNHGAAAAAANQQRRESRSSNSTQDQHHNNTASTTYEAADALTALATLGGNQGRELPSPTAFSHAPRRTSSFGSHAAPIEPSPPIDNPQAHSPTLEHYHHGSNSPEQQRRRSSLLQRSSSPAPVLAPIQNLSGVLHENNHNEPKPMSHSYGQDVSRIVSPPSGLGDGADLGRDNTQNREPAFVRDEPTTTQIREPESMNSTPVAASAIVSPPQDTEAQLPSPLPVIKSEPAGTPREATPSTNIVPSSERHQSITADSVDVETRKAIEALKQNDLGLRAKRNASVSESVTSPDPKPAPSVSKKRPAPTATSIKKKGTAAPKKPAPKRRKLDPETDSAPRSSTPTNRSKSKAERAGKKGSQAGTPVGSSPAPDNASQADASDDDAESSDDNSLYCICRKPDNHRWMIGCDGGCDDWFHGSCVDMAQADEDLVDKFICPNCEENGRGQTTWKAMCRREGCRKPARSVKGRESKYCSDDCGTLFMQDQLQRTAGAKKTSKKSRRKGGKDGEEHGNATDEDEEPTPLGGVLRAKDLKALVVSSNNIEDFKRLGSGVLSPPQTASPSRSSFDSMTNGTVEPTAEFPFTPSEIARLKALWTEKVDLQTKLEALKDREKFVSMVREQAGRLAEREKIKPKEFCGYDSRLSWSDNEFLAWRKTKLGRAAFKFNTLSPTDEQTASLEAESEQDTHTNGTNALLPHISAEPAVCLKKRCPKHPQWQKLNLQDARFEEVEAVEAIKECEKEERSVRERARRRGQKDAVAADLVGGTSTYKTGGGEGGEEKTQRKPWLEPIDTPRHVLKELSALGQGTTTN